MTRKLLVLFLTLLLLTFVSSANAQTTTTGSVPTTTTPVAIDAATKLKLQMQLVKDQKKEIVSETKSIIQAKKDEFKTKLQLIKDQKKKTLVENIDAKLTKVNGDYTIKFLDVVTRLQTFLEKIKQSTVDATAMTMTDIATAQTAIDTAKTAVEAQVEKSYTMNITDDSALKLNAGMIVSQFKQDLVAVYKLVLEAKQAVQKLDADKELIKKEATSSAKL
jgi:hypothetical protein